MKRKRVWRYYCDFCGRGGCAGGHIKSHEASCTANPLRECRFHSALGEDQPTMPNLIAALESCGGDWVAGMRALRELADNCPACILAAIRQTGLNQKIAEGWMKNPIDLGFNFREAVASFWNDHNGREWSDTR